MAIHFIGFEKGGTYTDSYCTYTVVEIDDETMKIKVKGINVTISTDTARRRMEEFINTPKSEAKSEIVQIKESNIPSNNIDIRSDRILQKLEAYTIESLYYMSRIENIPSILARGILCKNIIITNGIPHKTFALPSVQDIRDTKLIPYTSYTIHDCVPLYFITKTPMQYYRKESQRGWVCIEIDAKKVFVKPNVVFTNGNAAHRYTKFYDDIVELRALNWRAMKRIKYEPSDHTCKQYKQAEILVPYKIDRDCFRRLIVHNIGVKQKLITMVRAYFRGLKDYNNNNYKIECAIDSSYFI